MQELWGRREAWRCVRASIYPHRIGVIGTNEDTIIRLIAPAKVGWFEVRTAFSGSGGTWDLPEGTMLRFAGLQNSPPIGSDPLPVPHFEVLSGDHAGHMVTALGVWRYEEKP